MVNVLFVCTGNVFRSLSAECLFRDFLEKSKIPGVVASSAGIEASIQPIDPEVRRFLASKGVDVSGHRQRKLSQRIIEEADLVVAMAGYHKDFIKSVFGVNVPLFDEIACGRAESVWDVNDAVPDYQSNRPAVVGHMRKVIQHIEDSMPGFYKNMHGWIKK